MAGSILQDLMILIFNICTHLFVIKLITDQDAHTFKTSAEHYLNQLFKSNYLAQYVCSTPVAQQLTI